MVQRTTNLALKIKLLEQNFTNRKLSLLTGIPESVVSQISRGVYIPSPEQIQKIADVLKCPVNEIFG